jgi:ABC-type nitrate/sulfonate/bicarbonate transport system substrate-binding protein
MKKGIREPLVVLVLFYVFVFIVFLRGSEAEPLKKIRASFSAFAYANPPFWIAKDLKLFEKYGLDVELIYVAGGRGIQVMLGGSVDVAQIGGSATVIAAARGAEVAILGTVFPRLVSAVHARPEIKEIKDLKGKTLGTGIVGGNSYFGGRLFLSKIGFVPNRDIFIRAVGGTPEVFAALQAGQVQAGVLAPPTTAFAARAGFREIFDTTSLELPFPAISVVSTRKFAAENPDIILNVLRATSEAIHLYKTRPELTLPVVAKYMRVLKDDPAIRESQATYGQKLDQNLEISLEGIKFIIETLAEQGVPVKRKDPGEYVDSRFRQKLEEEGFFKKLSGK